MPREPFTIDLVPASLHKHHRKLDSSIFRRMRLPKALWLTKLSDLDEPVASAARQLVSVLDTLVGPLAQIYIFYGGVNGQHTTLTAGFMKIAHSFGFLTLWADFSELRSYDSPVIEDDRTLHDTALDVDLLVIDCSSIQDLVGKRANTTDLRRLLRRRILENRSTVINISGRLQDLLIDEQRSLMDVFGHSAQRTMFVDGVSGKMSAGTYA